MSYYSVLELIRLGSFILPEPSKRRKYDLSFADIPEDIFIKICSYLTLPDIWRMGRVCSRWYNFTRSESLCTNIDTASLNLSREKTRKLLKVLPESVKQLRIGNCYDRDKKESMSIPDLFYILQNRFPQLGVLIIENVLLLKPYREYYQTNGFMLNCKVPEKLQIRGYYKSLRYKVDYKDADFNTLVYLLPNLTVLSLRSSMIAIGDVVKPRIPSSAIKVLDLTQFLSATDSKIRALCQLPYLEELYLAGTAITVNGVFILLKEVPRLKVLDLDNTVIGGETFEVLRLYGKSLVELYLGKTAIQDCDMINTDKGTFPVLKKLCLQSTMVSEISVKKLLLSVPSLTQVILTKSRTTVSWILDQPVYMRTKIIYNDLYEVGDCNHFRQNAFQRAF